MLHKWKLILSNWINCFFNSKSKKDSPIILESLLDIISHLRENLSLDESKSSLLDAHTVQEFMIEKYPDFIFENGSVEPASEDDVYLVASLLLFFVCVNSKNVDMKSAMCSQLSPGDQEIILKFSKHLMECSKITITDVQAAITEACGQEMAAVETSPHMLVPETPPALRSFHSEVRRLQAALDAERFDRNYLQEELTRTNMKVEKLLKDKEQYKIEIVNLKSQIMTGCLQDKECQGNNVEANDSSKLLRQLGELEQRLLCAQEELADAQSERENYKTKLHQLKADHEKLMELIHQESARASSLSDELETERRQTQSLRELVTELRQHNQLNKIDSSLLECDDPDASIHSLQHNSSTCSEVCVNVIEVQLGEERAKVTTLKQQILILQDQLCLITKKAEEEKKSFTEIISEKESTIINLKHQVSEEINGKNIMKTILEDDIAKLNNEINELEQRLKGNQENSRHIIENKMHEIQNLQEEKLTLLQSLSDETTKLEGIIKDLQYEVDAEKSSKIRLRDEYDNHIMKLNEKVLNRNNELVELQNKIFEKGEHIEKLQFDLRKEKELQNDLSNKHNEELMQLHFNREQMEHSLQQKTEEAKDLHKHLQQHIGFIEQLNKDNENLNTNILQLREDCDVLKESKEKLLIEIKNRDVKADQIYKETENLKNLLSEEKQRLQYSLEESSIRESGLKNQLQHEIQAKLEVQSKLQESQVEISNLSKEIMKLKADLQVTSLEKSEDEKQFKALNQELTDLKRVNVALIQDLEEINIKLEKVTQELVQKNTIVEDIKNELESNKKLYHDTLLAKDEVIKSIEAEIHSEISKKNVLEVQLNSLEIDKEQLVKVLNEKESNILGIQHDYKILSETLQEKEATIKSLQLSLTERAMECTQLKDKYDADITNLNIRLDETENSLKEVMAKSNNVIEGKDLLIQTLNVKADQIEKMSKQMQENLTQAQKENKTLVQQIAKEKLCRQNIETEYLNQCSSMRNFNTQLNEEIHKKGAEISCLQGEIKSLMNALNERNEEIKLLEWNLTESSQNFKDTMLQKEDEIRRLNKNIMEKEQLTTSVIEGINEEIHINVRKIATLEEENKYLRLQLESNVKNHEEILEHKNSLIYDLQQKLETKTKQLENTNKCFTEDRTFWEKTKFDLEAKISANQSIINDLSAQISEALSKLNDESKRNEALLSEKDILSQELLENVSIKKILEEEKKLIEQELEKEMNMRVQMTQEMECITEQLVKEQLAKQLAEEDKKSIVLSKEELQMNLDTAVNLKQALDTKNNELITKIEVLSKDKDWLETKLTQVEAEMKTLKMQSETNLLQEIGHKNDLKQKISNLIAEKDNLLKQLDDETACKTKLEIKNDVLSQEMENIRLEKEYLLNEKEIAMKDLIEFKQQIEKLTDDKYALTHKLQGSNDMYLTQLQDKQEEIQRIFSDYMTLKSDFKKLDEGMTEIESALDRGVQFIKEVFKKEELSEELGEILEEDNTDNMELINKCNHFARLASLLTAELVMKKNSERTLQQQNASVEEVVKQRELQISQLEAEITSSHQVIEQLKVDSSKLREQCNSSLDSKNRDIQALQDENKILHNELNDVKIQLDCKVHSLKEKLTDNENLTDKLKKTYDCQINNLNVMVNKLTSYLKDKTVELDQIRKEKDKLQHIVEDNTTTIRALNDDVQLEKEDKEKLLSDFESERLVLKNMVTVTESVMEDQKISLNNVISDHLKLIELLQNENNMLKSIINTEKQNAEIIIKEKSNLIETALKDLSNLGKEKADLEDCKMSEIQLLTDEISKFKEETRIKAKQIEELTFENKEMKNLLLTYKNDVANLQEKSNEWKILKDAAEVELTDEILKLKKELMEKSEDNTKLESLLQENQAIIKSLNDRIVDLDKQISCLEIEKNELITSLEEIKVHLEAHAQAENEELCKLKHDNKYLLESLETQKSEIIKLESLLMYEKQQNRLQKEDDYNEKQSLTSKCGLLQEYQAKAEQELERRQVEIESLTVEIKELKEKSENVRNKDELINHMCREKDALISKFSKELIEERDKWIKELESRAATIVQLTQQLEDVTRSETDSVKLLRKENEVLKKTIALKESFAVAGQEKSSHKSGGSLGADARDQLHQVDTTPTDHTQTSLETYKTISDLEKIVQDRNRTITSLQSDVTYLKSLMAESENKLLDVSKDLETTKENCQQLSGQLKKIVYQKNEEIAELKKQLTKMSVTENRASQIIKVSAKYQAIILKRIAEIKSNTVLKELTNFGNTGNCDNDLRRSLTAGTVTMEDLENFLDTTDKHLKRCSEKQLALQKERDRLAEVNRINESEIINMRKFLTELSVSIKTFNSVKELYTQKFSAVIALQRTVRREILGLDGRVTDAAMCKLERGYAAAMQDLSECAMNLERWVERSVGRAISTEKIKQASSSDERPSLATGTFQNASLEVQLDELEGSFCRLLEEVARAQRGEGARDAQAVTVMEVRAEYEDKLSRMKAKMKELYQEQIAIFKEKQREEVAGLEKELQRAREKLEESSRAYEEHIRSLTNELWSVGEKFLMKQDEAEWLRRKQRSGSLMSLQHVHSSGLVPPQEEPSRPSDAHSLRSLPVSSNNNNTKKEGRTLQMSDEEGEVFDNRCLRELASTPAGAKAGGRGRRLSELQWRNSLCPPHLKSSYPAETQFVAAIHEEDIKCTGGPSMSLGGRGQRKEVGITAYKKPGPPTPSKQAGRLSATDSELRESLRVETEPNASRKTSTPSRIRALFRSTKADHTEGTPRSRRLSNMFRKK